MSQNIKKTPGWDWCWLMLEYPWVVTLQPDTEKPTPRPAHHLSDDSAPVTARVKLYSRTIWGLKDGSIQRTTKIDQVPINTKIGEENFVTVYESCFLHTGEFDFYSWRFNFNVCIYNDFGFYF